MLFGQNPQSDLLLAVIGLKRNDIERFRDVFVSNDGKTISVYTRTGGGNREDYPNLTMRKMPTWQGSTDDDFDSTYCTDTFSVPAEWHSDVLQLNDILGNGIRKEFGQHLLLTLRREPNESDKQTQAYNEEQAELNRTNHFLANGHTFVPQDDAAMETALRVAEAHDGELRSCWGILPLQLTVKQNFQPWPNAIDKEYAANITRVEVGYDWKIDTDYWEHCKKRWTNKFPTSMAKVAEAVQKQLAN